MLQMRDKTTPYRRTEELHPTIPRTAATCLEENHPVGRSAPERYRPCRHSFSQSNANTDTIQFQTFKNFTIMNKRILSLTLALLLGATLLAQAPPTPPGNPGSGNTPVGGGAAPLVGGIALLMGLAAGYGAMKLYYQFKK
jgi:hypothetical protein